MASLQARKPQAREAPALFAAQMRLASLSKGAHGFAPSARPQAREAPALFAAQMRLAPLAGMRMASLQARKPQAREALVLFAAQMRLASQAVEALGFAPSAETPSPRSTSPVCCANAARFAV
ncbi:hypothetical protein J7E73_08260 [Paenibacillus albidus]|uniref:hypothetical protein n=1 Tax=Paenibacillus albidus TaxID=2041023 RepID=UPI001BE67DCB|nr:hypothetical protein [Paenibacillus albidus]MBT2289125.1 hypothetical protein [Paenibacillus albidus]